MKFVDYLKVFIKGIILGLISMGIPGLSASTIAIIVGIYFLMVDAIANVFKDFKTNIKFLLTLILGYGVGAILAAFSVTILFEKFPLITTLVVLGLIIGSLPDMLIKLKPYFKKISCWITLVIVIFLILGYNFLISKGAEQAFPLDPNISYLIKLFFIGVITSSTFIIPGVDFAVVFLSLGIYYPFMTMITDLLKFTSPSYSVYFIGYIKILGVYLIGYFIGIFLFSKFIKFLSTKYYSQTQFASFAFIIAAPIIVVKNCIYDNNSFFYKNSHLIVGIILSIISIFIMFMVGMKSRSEENKHQIKIEENNIKA